MPKADTTAIEPVIEVPGEEFAPAETNDDSAARIAELEGTVAQQAALISQLNAQLQGMQTVPAALPQAEAPRIVGEDWSSMTSAEAKARGCTKTVLCRDGYFVPG